jgi:hypothetical protein
MLEIQLLLTSTSYCAPATELHESEIFPSVLVAGIIGFNTGAGSDEARGIEATAPVII